MYVLVNCIGVYSSTVLKVGSGCVISQLTKEPAKRRRSTLQLNDIFNCSSCIILASTKNHADSSPLLRQLHCVVTKERQQAGLDNCDTGVRIMLHVNINSTPLYIDIILI